MSALSRRRRERERGRGGKISFKKITNLLPQCLYQLGRVRIGRTYLRYETHERFKKLRLFIKVVEVIFSPFLKYIEHPDDHQMNAG